MMEEKLEVRGDVPQGTESKEGDETRSTEITTEVGIKALAFQLVS